MNASPRRTGRLGARLRPAERAIIAAARLLVSGRPGLALETLVAEVERMPGREEARRLAAWLRDPVRGGEASARPPRGAPHPPPRRPPRPRDPGPAGGGMAA